MNWLSRLLAPRARETLALRVFSLARIPLLFHIGARVSDITDERMVVVVPLRRRTRNHLGSMYFAALCAGADCAAGAFAMHFIRRRDKRISMVFKNFHAEFLRRAEGDVHFVCEQGRDIARLVARAAESGERVEQAFDVVAFVPNQGGEPVATFLLTLSLKRRD